MTPEKLLITNREAVVATFGKKQNDISKDVEVIRKWFITQRHLPEIPSKSGENFF